MADYAGVPLCADHAAAIAAEVRLVPIEARLAYHRLVKRDLPRPPVPSR